MKQPYSPTGMDEQIRALTKALTAEYRRIAPTGTDVEFAAFCVSADDAIAGIRPRTVANDPARRNVHFWLTQACTSAYRLSRDVLGDGVQRPRADFALVFYGLSMARRELRVTAI